MSKTSLYFSTVISLPDDSALVGGHLVSEGSSPTGTLLVHYVKNKWRLIAKIPDVVNGLSFRSDFNGKVYVGVIGRNGYFCEIDLSNKNITLKHQLKSIDYGYFEDIVLFKDSYYVCGSRRQIHTFNGEKWSILDSDIFSGNYSRSEFVEALHTSDPFHGYGSYGSEFILSLSASNALSACGSHGFFAIFDHENNTWSQLDAPTNVDFKVVYGDDDGSILLGAGSGMMYSVSQDGIWKKFQDPSFNNTVIRDILRFKGIVYCAAGNKILLLDDDKLEEVELPFTESVEVSRLSSSQNVLWAVGGELILKFDGNQWTSHISPTNQ